jgi:hypothetical protein
MGKEVKERITLCLTECPLRADNFEYILKIEA